MEELTMLVQSTPITTIAKSLNVSSTAVTKRCKRLGINRHKPGYWTKKSLKTVLGQ
jgi:hypothetical protein